MDQLALPFEASGQELKKREVAFIPRSYDFAGANPSLTGKTGLLL